MLLITCTRKRRKRNKIHLQIKPIHPETQRTWFLCAETKEEMENCINCINATIDSDAIWKVLKVKIQENRIDPEELLISEQEPLGKEWIWNGYILKLL